MSRVADLEGAIKHQAPAISKQPSENALHSLSGESVGQSIVKHRQPATEKVAPLNFGVLPPDAEEGLSQTALCNFYGLSWRNLKRNSAIAGFDAIKGYLQQMTGVDWRQVQTAGMTKLYFPNELTQTP